MFHLDTDPLWTDLVSTLLGYVVLAFTFPCGLMVETFTGGVSTLPILAPFYVPVNAYLWGALATRLFPPKRDQNECESVGVAPDETPNSEGDETQ